MPSRLTLYAVLCAGVIAVGWAAIFIRLAEAPALSVAAYRLTIAATLVLLLLRVRGPGVQPAFSRADRLPLAVAGVALALHFATWIASLGLTTVASSVALVTTQPLWAALLGARVLGEPVGRRTLGGIVVATLGGALIGWGDLGLGSRALIGDALALTGAVCAAVYFIAGRRVRGHIPLLPYIGAVYSIAAVVLLAMALLARQPLAGFSAQTWVFLLLLALVPQLVGHTALNWALRYLPAHLVGVAVLGEPVIAALLALPILGERPGGLLLLGGTLTLAGVAVVLGAQQPTPADAAVPDAVVLPER